MDSSAEHPDKLGVHMVEPEKVNPSRTLLVGCRVLHRQGGCCADHGSGRGQVEGHPNGGGPVDDASGCGWSC